jgi:hypothetical protein
MAQRQRLLNRWPAETFGFRWRSMDRAHHGRKMLSRISWIPAGRHD